MLLFPENVLTLVFGPDYIEAKRALQILSLGFLIGTPFMSSGHTLIAMGKTHFLMWASISAAIVNIILNVTLIPSFGIEGAALATAISWSFYSIIRWGKLRILLKSTPITRNLVKSTIVSSIAIALLAFLIKVYFPIGNWLIPLLLMMFYCIHFLAILFTRSFDKEDLIILSKINKKIRIRH
jgi:O-antigen/teichoic acid export membrane protein